jgi:hypothetical protein
MLLRTTLISCVQRFLQGSWILIKSREIEFAEWAGIDWSGILFLIQVNKSKTGVLV